MIHTLSDSPAHFPLQFLPGTASMDNAQSFSARLTGFMCTAVAFFQGSYHACLSISCECIVIDGVFA
jgi:hypothetical protein